MYKVLAAIAVAVVLAVAFGIWRQPAPETSESDEASPPSGGEAIVSVVVPENLSAEAQMGQRAFEAKCMTCHGVNAAGRQGKGPPLVHKVYEPGHHGDITFELAVSRGVVGHHWDFGSMLPVDGLTRAEVRSIVAFVRALQKENDIW